MNITGKIKNRVINEDGEMELTVLVPNLYNQELCRSLKKDLTYCIKLEEVKGKRSLSANNLMWKMLDEITKKLNGGVSTSDDLWNNYINLLEKAGVKKEFVCILPEAEEMLKKQFRAIRFVNVVEMSGINYWQYIVYTGSSKFNTKEMSQLIDILKVWCSELEIEVDYVI